MTEPLKDHLTAATRFTISDKGADDKELLFFTRVIIQYTYSR